MPPKPATIIYFFLEKFFLLVSRCPGNFTLLIQSSNYIYKCFERHIKGHWILLDLKFYKYIIREQISLKYLKSSHFWKLNQRIMECFVILSSVLKHHLEKCLMCSYFLFEQLSFVLEMFSTLSNLFSV